jgi:Fe-S cluster biogenesis protein NfuA
VRNLPPPERSPDDTAAAVQLVVDQVIRPLLRTHGGGCEVLSVNDGVVELAFGDACTGCRLRPFTLLGAIRPRLLGIHGVTEVRARGVGVSRSAIERFDRLARRQATGMGE